MRRLASVAFLLGSTLLASACGGEGKSASAASATAASSATPGVETPDPGRKIITVDMVTDGDGNFFEPEEVTAQPGDVIRFVLKTGVHNARFVPDSNPGAARLPKETPYLQIPGQTYDIKVDVPPGRYYYHCDPHALIGMIGYLNVTP